ncbi:MAG: hypothetical protein ACI3XR_01375 [Eubacteriales bacterium]
MKMNNNRVLSAMGCLDDDLLAFAAEDMMTEQKSKILSARFWAKGIAVAASLCLVVGGACGIWVWNNGTAPNSTTGDYDKTDLPSDSSNGLNVGFLFPDGCASSGAYTGYRSDSSRFNPDDVTLTFYFGSKFYDDLDFERESVMDVREVKLYFVNDDGDQYFIRQTKDWYVSEEYRCIPIWENIENVAKIVGVEYNHSEVITIPRELFTKPSGYIVFKVMGDNLLDEYENAERTLNSVIIYYSLLEDGSVLLSEHPNTSVNVVITKQS